MRLGKRGQRCGLSGCALQNVLPNKGGAYLCICIAKRTGRQKMEWWRRKRGR